MLKYVLITVTLAVVMVSLVGAQESTATPREIVTYDEDDPIEVTFDDEDDWERFVTQDGKKDIGVLNGVYRMRMIELGGYLWGLNDMLHTDIVIEVDVMQLSVYHDNAFGVMCRADISNNGDGYYFMYNANGYYSIRIGDGDRFLPLVDWTRARAIETEINTNHLKVICAGDYLALYINDVLLAEAYDPTFTSGFAGLAIASVADTASDAQFDDLYIYEVEDSED